MMSNPQDRKNDPNRDTNLSGYERMCHAYSIVPNPQQVALARANEEDEKNLLKNLARNVRGRGSAAVMENIYRAWDIPPNPIVMKAAKELDEEEAAKTKSKSK